MITPDEGSPESCLDCEVKELVQEQVEGQKKADTAELPANLEEAGTWYYVVDCARCAAVIPFKYAPEDEPILRFPAMRVRCFDCRTDHTYAADLVSHRKAAAPRKSSKNDQAPCASDSDREASPERQEDCDVGGSRVHVVLEYEIDPVSSSLHQDNIAIATASGQTATLFFLSSCFFAVGWVGRIASDILYPVQPAVLNELRSSGSAMLMDIAYFGAILLGLALFVFGTGNFIVEACGSKHNIHTFVLRTFTRLIPIWPVDRLLRIRGGFLRRRHR
jgi:hypothetical protein